MNIIAEKLESNFNDYFYLENITFLLIVIINYIGLVINGF